MHDEPSAIEDQTAVLRSDASATIYEVRESLPPPVGLPIDAPPWRMRKVTTHVRRVDREERFSGEDPFYSRKRGFESRSGSTGDEGIKKQTKDDLFPNERGNG